ncbi:hypothetical protein J3R82DRAFT_5010, partial [Butyriboletus roseoflavus]
HGVHGFNVTIAHRLAQYGLGRALLDAVSMKQGLALTDFLAGWRIRLQDVLRNDPEGWLGQKYGKLTNLINEPFPNHNILQYYANPLITFSTQSSTSDSPISGPSSFPHPLKSYQPCIEALAAFCMQHFSWRDEGLVAKMRSTIWEGACLQLLCGVSRTSR